MKNKNWNGQALAELACYLLFGGTILYLILSNRYLSYVTPKMKPYLYFTAAVMLIWTGVSLTGLFRLQRRKRTAHCLILIIPVLLILLPHSGMSASSLSGTANLMMSNAAGSVLGSTARTDDSSHHSSSQSGGDGIDSSPLSADNGSDSPLSSGGNGADTDSFPEGGSSVSCDGSGGNGSGLSLPPGGDGSDTNPIAGDSAATGVSSASTASTGKNSGAAAASTGKNSSASAASTGKNSGAAVASTGKDSGASAASTGKDSGASAASIGKDSGASAASIGKNSGASASSTGKNSGASVASTGKDSGASAPSTGKDSGASAPSTGQNDSAAAAANSSGKTGASHTSGASGASAPKTALSDIYMTTDPNTQSKQLHGYDPKNKTITVSNDEYYDWVNEFFNNFDQLKGFKVTITGAVYKDDPTLEKNQFVPVRLVMTCCVADLTPLGVVCTYDKVPQLKSDQWVTVTGTLYQGKYKGENEPRLMVTSIKAAKPVPGYIYPYA